MTSTFSTINDTNYMNNISNTGVVSVAVNPQQANYWITEVKSNSTVISMVLKNNSFIISSFTSVISVILLLLSFFNIISIFPLLFINTFLFGLGISLTVIVKVINKSNSC